MKMKRILVILSLLCILPVCADAQWYLFPGNKKKQQHKKENTKEITIELTPVDSTKAEDKDSTIVDSLLQEIEDYIYDKVETINISLILPLQTLSQNPSSSFFEMYGGALLAIKDLGDSGVKMNLKVIDSARENFEIDQETVDQSNIIMGPVSYKDLLAALPYCDVHQMLISPLEPRAAMLADSSNVIQAPSSWTNQVDDLVDWLSEEISMGDEVIVLRETSPQKEGEQSSRLILKLNEKNIRYRTAASLEEIAMNEALTYRVLIASDNDAFITRAVRSAGISSELKKQIILYTTSRVRNCVDANVMDLYNANTRMTAAYHIDYNDQQVKDFVLKYRALFKNEPGSFAFQGYDVMKYFVSMCNDYGRRWYRKLPERSSRGLQSDFVFDRKVSKGKTNTAVRRVIYNKDLTTTLLPLQEETPHWPMQLH